MTTKPKVKKFRIRRGGDTGTRPETTEVPDGPSAQDELEAISKEGLTARQLRMARRVAQKHGLTVQSDFDAVRQLRAANIDPFQRNSVLELVKPDAGKDAPKASKGNVQLPQPAPKTGAALQARERKAALAERARDVSEIQRDIARRRRRKLALLFTRLSFFILLPTFMVGWYFFTMATPMYATKSEIVIQQAQAQQPMGGFAGLFQGTSMATQQDSIAVQSYLASREAMLRLDQDHGFKDHFSSDQIDEIQRLPAEATNEQAFKTYVDRVRISYDPTEGIIRMEVVAADPEKSRQFSEALIGYAEEQVDQLTARLRTDQMRGARESYEDAEARRAEALAAWLAIQEEFQQIDTTSETTAIMSQIAALESDRQRQELVLRSRMNVARPSETQIQILQDQIANIDALILELRARMTDGTGGADEAQSLAERNTRLRTAEENYSFQTILVQQALTQMETAQIEANRQVRYLSLSVRPTTPDEASYPRAFENTLLAFFIFSGIYLMISLTASILREQVSS